MNVNQRFKEIREDKKLSQIQFAKKLGIRQATVSAIENGSNLSQEVIEKVCIEFEVYSDWLLFGNEPKYKNSKQTKEESVLRSEADKWKEKYYETLEKLNQHQEQQIGQLQKQAQSLKNIPLAPSDK